MKSLKEIIEDLKATAAKVRAENPEYRCYMTWNIDNFPISELKANETKDEKMEYKDSHGGSMRLYVRLDNGDVLFAYSKPGVKVKVTTEILGEEKEAV
ncbi:MAG: hypothetical protein NVS1B13_24710 [Flavisolibacter sp.]